MPSAHGAACIYACHSHSDQPPPTTVQVPNKDDVATKIIPYPIHITSEPDTLALIDDILNAWGRLDVWVCNSGLLGPPSIDMTTPEDLQRVWESNSLAPFYALKYAPPSMGKTCEKRRYPNASEKDRGYGSIIVVGSVASTYGGKQASVRNYFVRAKSDSILENQNSRKASVENCKTKLFFLCVGCWGPCFTMSSHAALGVVRAGVAVLKGTFLAKSRPRYVRIPRANHGTSIGTGVRVNCISPGQIDVGVDLKGSDVRGMRSQLPPAELQSKEVGHA